MKRLTLAALVLLLCGTTPLWPQQKKQGKKPSQPTPTAANVAYGSHERQVLDFWQAKSDLPTPLVLYIHGGGWKGGDKNSLNAGAIKAYRDAGLSVAELADKVGLSTSPCWRRIKRLEEMGVILRRVTVLDRERLRDLAR